MLADLKGRCDLVLIDAPALHRPEAWRRNPGRQVAHPPRRRLSSASRIRDETLESALGFFVKKGGRIVYVTCSVIRAENEDRIGEFLSRHDDLLPIDAAAQARSAGLPALADHQSTLGPPGFSAQPRERPARTGFISRR